MFIAAVFTVYKRKQLKSPSTSEWDKKSNTYTQWNVIWP